MVEMSLVWHGLPRHRKLTATCDGLPCESTTKPRGLTSIGEATVRRMVEGVECVNRFRSSGS
jgi:hypothetical protein